MADEAAPKETPEERRARKAREKEANLQRITAEVDEMLKPLPDDMDFNALQMEHAKLREKITEIQHLVIQGRFDIKKAQDFEKTIVARIHEVEERARDHQTGRHVPRPEK